MKPVPWLQFLGISLFYSLKTVLAPSPWSKFRVLAFWTAEVFRIAKGSLFQRNGPHKQNDLSENVLHLVLETSDNSPLEVCLVDQANCFTVTRSCRYCGALLMRHFHTMLRILNSILYSMGSHFPARTQNIYHMTLCRFDPDLWLNIRKVFLFTNV